MPIRNKNAANGYEQVLWPIMDPHAIIAYLFNNAGLNIPTLAVEDFWRKSRAFGEEWALQSEASDRHIPLGLYGDSARVKTEFGGESVAAIFLNLPLWRPKSVRASRFLITTIQEELLFGYHTLNGIWHRVTWSCNQLFFGRHPSLGPKGEQLPEHMADIGGTAICVNNEVFVVTELRGDWSWQKKIFRFKGASWVWTSKNTCHQCSAQTTGGFEHAYYNVETGSWRGHDFTLPEFLTQRMPDQGLCRLIEFSGPRIRIMLAPFASMTLPLGPLLGLKSFHPGIIKWCAMHTIHLGLLFVCNGASLQLG